MRTNRQLRKINGGYAIQNSFPPTVTSEFKSMAREPNRTPTTVSSRMRSPQGQKTWGRPREQDSLPSCVESCYPGSGAESPPTVWRVGCLNIKHKDRSGIPQELSPRVCKKKVLILLWKHLQLVMNWIKVKLEENLDSEIAEQVDLAPQLAACCRNDRVCIDLHHYYSISQP